MKNRFLLLAGIACMLVSCASRKELYEHYSHDIVADTIAARMQADSRMRETRRYTDSVFAMFLQHVNTEQSAQEQSTETVSETVSESTDSLGRTVKTSLRTTTRTLQRQEQQRQEQMVSDVMERVNSRLAAIDSEWQQRLAMMQTHWEDSLNTLSQQLRQKSSTVEKPWYMRLWTVIQVVGGIIVILACVRMWMKHPFCRQ